LLALLGAHHILHVSRIRVKSSFRKDLDKNHRRTPAGKSSKNRLQDEGEGSETKQKEKNRSSKWEPQVGNLVLANAK